MTLATKPKLETTHLDEQLIESLRLEQSIVKNKIIYEQPLNERMRSWLRLEHLFDSITYHLHSPSAWDSRSVVEAMLEILAFVSRNDIKPDLIKDLEYQFTTLQRWQTMPQVDTARLEKLLKKIQYFLNKINHLERQFGQSLLEHHLMNGIRQRSNIPGGTCRFDLPAYHHWLQKSPKIRQNDLLEWLEAFHPLREANELNLYLIRQNALPSHETAQAGFFQTKLDTHMDIQIIRIALPHDIFLYPEMSGGKHRVTLRFLEQKALDDKPTQTEQDVNFELCCCSVIEP